LNLNVGEKVTLVFCRGLLRKISVGLFFFDEACLRKLSAARAHTLKVSVGKISLVAKVLKKIWKNVVSLKAYGSAGR
jgi:hypothetical protein